MSRLDGMHIDCTHRETHETRELATCACYCMSSSLASEGTVGGGMLIHRWRGFQSDRPLKSAGVQFFFTWAVSPAPLDTIGTPQAIVLTMNLLFIE